MNMKQSLTNITIILLLTVCACVLFSCPAQAELMAGAAKVSITPDVKADKIPLGGYAARKGIPSTGVHDLVYSRALVLVSSNTKLAIVSVDLCFLPKNVKAEVLKRIVSSGGKNWNSANVLIAATHTHTAPDPLAMHSGNSFKLNGWTLFDQKLLDFTAAHIAESILSAEKNLAPAQSGVAQKDTDMLNRNRRGDILTDPAMTTMKVTDRIGHVIATLVNFAAHPTLYDEKMLEISADWPGVMTKDVETLIGGVCLFLNGAEGDASPNGADGVNGDEKVALYGHKVSKVALELIKTAPLKPDTEIASWMTPVKLPPRKASAMYLIAASQLGASFVQAKELVNGLMPESTEVGFVRIGDLLLIGMPCEPTAAIGLQVKASAKQAGYKTTGVVALANDWLAYALTSEQYDAGKYEAMMSFYGNQFGPSLLKGISDGFAHNTHP